MKERPENLEDDDVRLALREGWGIDAAAMRYVALGAGAFHWDVEATDGKRWFVSASDFDLAPWLGPDRATSLVTLRATMNTARLLRADVGLRFVLAAVPAGDDGVVRVVRERYGLVVHPYVDGSCGEFGDPLAATEVATVVEIVAALHAVPPSAAALHELVDLDARTTLTSERYRPILDRYEELQAHTAGRALVLTHGEPHAGNLLRADGSLYLIDWDTAAMARPERDLWLLTDHGHADVVTLYEQKTGHTVDLDAMAFYRLRWAIEWLIGAVQEQDEAGIQRALAPAKAAAGID